MLKEKQKRMTACTVCVGSVTSQQCSQCLLIRDSLTNLVRLLLPPDLIPLSCHQARSVRFKVCANRYAVFIASLEKTQFPQFCFYLTLRGHQSFTRDISLISCPILQMLPLHADLMKFVPLDLSADKSGSAEPSFLIL